MSGGLASKWLKNGQLRKRKHLSRAHYFLFLIKKPPVICRLRFKNRKLLLQVIRLRLHHLARTACYAKFFSCLPSTQMSVGGPSWNSLKQFRTCNCNSCTVTNTASRNSSFASVEVVWISSARFIFARNAIKSMTTLKAVGRDWNPCLQDKKQDDNFVEIRT